MAVVIVNYNVKHFLEQCLKSVMVAAKAVETEIWVVDNNSVDGSVAMVKEGFPSVHLIANTENVGFSKANNQAIRASKSTYVLLLNPDTVIPDDCLSKVVAFMDDHPDAGACGIRMIDGQGKFLPESKRGLPTPEVALYKMMGLNKLFPRSKKFGKYHLGYLDEHQTHEVDVLAGAFMLLRRQVLDEVGLLDETFFMYGEDIDLSYRITQAGYRNFYYPASTIIHYKGESTKKQSVNYVRIFYKAMIIFAEKHYSGRNQRAFTAFINAAIYLRAGLSLGISFVKRHGLKVLEMLLIFFSLLLLKDYWEEHIKYIDEYPAAMLRIHLPYYTLSWMLCLISLGSYTHYFQLGRLIRATAIGTLLILVIYGLLPDELHFSRGIILFGFLVITATLLLFRILVHAIQYHSLDLNKSKTIRSVFIGNPEKWSMVRQLLDKRNDDQYQQIGFLNDTASEHSQYLGKITQLQEVVQIFDVNEIIFSSATVNPSKIMDWMNRIGSHVNYYIVPEDSNFVIGSHSKNATGVYFGEQIRLNLSKPEYRRQKRAFDLISSALLLILLPLSLILFFRHKIYKKLNEVFLGKKTWISYSSHDDSLPTIRTGIYSTDVTGSIHDETQKRQLDYLYAKNYSVNQDLILLWKALRK